MKFFRMILLSVGILLVMVGIVLLFFLHASNDVETEGVSARPHFVYYLIAAIAAVVGSLNIILFSRIRKK